MPMQRRLGGESALRVKMMGKTEGEFVSFVLRGKFPNKIQGGTPIGGAKA